MALIIAKTSLNAVPMVDDKGSYFKVLGVTSSEVILYGQEGKTGSVSLSELNNVVAEQRIDVVIENDNYELTAVPVVVAKSQKTGSGKAGCCGLDFNSRNEVARY